LGFYQGLELTGKSENLDPVEIPLPDLRLVRDDGLDYSSPMARQKYLHGFNKKEQNRLLHQARFLEPYVYSGVDLEFTQRLLEVGCGVGAQTEILLRRFPDLKIDGVDLSMDQLAMARKILARPLRQKRVRLFQKDAQTFSMPDAGKYEAAFLCWFLEHVPEPLKVLKRVRRQLKPGAKVYCTEVFNQTLFMEPYSPAYLNYWSQFNDYQWTIKGHPFIGVLLGHLLQESGFVDIQTEVRPFLFDSREPEKRAAFTEEFFQILLSAEKTLLAEKRVTMRQIQEMKREVAKVKKARDAVFFYAFIRATARVPN
jgi:ubiquinone/menaquinone biosynthesis C-methylase UbiE